MALPLPLPLPSSDLKVPIVAGEDNLGPRAFPLQNGRSEALRTRLRGVANP